MNTTLTEPPVLQPGHRIEFSHHGQTRLAVVVAPVGVGGLWKVDVLEGNERKPAVIQSDAGVKVVG